MPEATKYGHSLVALADPTTGAPYVATGGSVTEVRAQTGSTPSSFTATTSTVIWSANASAKLRTITNDSDQDLLITLGAVAVSLTSYHIRVKASGGAFVTSDYGGEVRGILVSAIGTGKVLTGEAT